MDFDSDDSAESSRAASSTAINVTEHEVDVKPGRAINFAEKIHFVLANRECRDAIAWLPSGRSFCITNKEKFVKVILPKFFKSRANFNSFERRLKTWGFHKIDTSSNLYIFSHESFGKDSRAKAELKAGSTYTVVKQLRVVLSNPEYQPFISWLPSGRSFCINSKDDFIRNVMKKHFGVPNFRGFINALLSNGFKRVQTGDFIGDAVYSHELFQIGRPDLCSLMHRVSDAIRESRPFATDARRMAVNGGISLAAAAAAAPSAAFRSVMNPSSSVPQGDVTYPIPARGVGMSTGGRNQVPAGGILGSMSSTNSLLQSQAMNYPFMNPGWLDFRYLPPNATFATNQQYPLMQYPQGNQFADLVAAQGIPKQRMIPSTCRLSDSMLPYMLNQQHPTVAQDIIQQQSVLPAAARRQSDSMLQLESSSLEKHQNPMVQAQASGIQQQPTVPAEARGLTAGPSREHHDRKISTTSQSLVLTGQAEKIQLSNASARRVSCPSSDEVAQKLEEERAKATKEMKMAMLDIDTELLRVKEMKLLNMQRKLKLSLETDGQK